MPLPSDHTGARPQTLVTSYYICGRKCAVHVRHSYPLRRYLSRFHVQALCRKEMTGAAASLPLDQAAPSLYANDQLSKLVCS